MKQIYVNESLLVTVYWDPETREAVMVYKDMSVAAAGKPDDTFDLSIHPGSRRCEVDEHAFREFVDFARRAYEAEKAFREKRYAFLRSLRPVAPVL